MIEKELDIQTVDGAMNTFITHPEEEGPHPVILFLMDAPGKRGELHDMARRLGTLRVSSSGIASSAKNRASKISRPSGLGICET